MAEQAQSRVSIHLWIGAGTAVAGVLVILLAGIEHDPRGFWADHIKVLRGTGWLALQMGLVWLVLALAARYTRFFSAEHGIDASHFAVSLVIIAVLVGLAIYFILPHMPATGPKRLPADPKMRAKVLGLERNFRVFVSFALVAVGLSLAAFPCRRFFRR